MRTKTGLVINDGVDKNLLQRLTVNLLPNKCRLETLEGRSHTVVPMIMLLEGVHTGSNGALLYPGEELSKTPESWNHKPVVVYHPEANGEGISACNPVIINNRKIGLILNSRYDKGQLKAEAWIEPSRADAVDPRIMTAITSNQMMELSTGVYVDYDKTPGQWKNESYTTIARNYRPDHLALLPDRIGACSISDGAGFLRNEARKGSKTFMHTAFQKLMERWGLSNNEMSFSNIRDNLATELRKKFNIVIGNDGPFLWIEDVYSNFAIYEMDGKLFQIGYEASDTGVTLSGEAPVEVKRVTEYRTVAGAAFVGNVGQPQQKVNNMNKAALIISILAANAGWTDKDKPVLEAMTDDQVKGIHNGLPKVSPAPPAAPTANEVKKKALVDGIIAQNAYSWGEADRTALMAFNEQQLAKIQLTAPAPAAPAAPVVPAKVVTAEEYIAQAPSGVQEVLRNSMDSLNKEKANLIEAITKNAANPYTKEELNVYPIGDLRKLARFAAPKSASTSMMDYSGQMPVTDNTQGLSEPCLEIPVMDFSKK